MRQDWLKSYCIGTVCDLTAGNGALGFQALLQNVSYLGVCYNDYHMVEMYKHLADLTFDAMWREDSPLYDAKLAEVLKDDGGAKAKEKEKEKQAEKRKKPEKKADDEEESGGKKQKKGSNSSADSLLAQLQALRGAGGKAGKAAAEKEEEEDDDE